VQGHQVLKGDQKLKPNKDSEHQSS
jgi:hypothetical protein